MVIKTNALIYDDRFRKEVQSLQRLGTKVTASVIEDANSARHGYDYGEGANREIIVFSLLTRRLLLSRVFIIFHLFEFILRTCYQVFRKKPQTVWIHDPILLVFMPFLSILRSMGVIEKIVWDHHELPIQRINDSAFLRRIFSWFCDFADVVIAANQERLDYLRERFPGFDKVDARVIRNYSDKEFTEQPVKTLPDELNTWLAGREYFLLQSGLVEIRQGRTVIEAILSDKSFPVVIAVGGGQTKLIDELRSKYGDLFDERVYLIGKVPQMELTRYLDGAIASFIFYQKAYGINNWLCEPNRLFQALNRNIPVIVGNNPPMAAAVDKYKRGIVVEDDGSQTGALVNAIRSFLSEKEHFPNLSKSQSLSIRWESQDEIFIGILNLSSAQYK